jgi:hypothetical protein
LRLGAIWRWFRGQSAGYWLVCFYLFLEYVRPQAIYPALSGVPWAFLTLILASLAVLLGERRRRPWNIADTGMTAFTIIVILSLFQAYDPSYALDFERLTYYFGWVVAYIIITTIVNTRARFLVFFLLFLLWHLKMSQHAVRSWVYGGFGFNQYIVGGPGWFHNAGEMGIAMVMFLPLSATLYLALRRNWSRVKRWVLLFLPASALIAVAASSSRGAQLAAVAVGAWFLLKSRQRVRGTIIAVLAGAALYFMLPETQLQRFREMGDDKTSQQRLTYWRNGLEIMARHPVLGVGYKNWLPYYSHNYEGRVQVPHNIFIEAGTELGYTGLGAFVFLIGATLVVNARTRKQLTRAEGKKAPMTWVAHGLDAAMIGYLVAGFFVTVLYYPFFWINLALSVALCEATRPRPAPALRASLQTAPTAASLRAGT